MGVAEPMGKAIINITMHNAALKSGPQNLQDKFLVLAIPVDPQNKTPNPEKIFKETNPNLVQQRKIGVLLRG